MLRSLKEVQADDSVIGFYQATTLGAFFNQTLVDTQAIHQDKLRHGGIVIVHGTHVANAWPEMSTQNYFFPVKIFHKRHEGTPRSTPTG